MAGNRSHLPESARNPFEGTGLDKELVGTLLEGGDQSLTIALTGLKRSIIRALHPDTGANPDTSDYLDSFLRSTSRLLDDMDEGQRHILATAYTKKRGRTPRATTPEFVYESKDLHDGSLLRNMLDMVADSGESIASSKGKRYLVRPLDFSSREPQSKAIGLFDVAQDGRVQWQQSHQTSLAHLFRQEYGRQTELEHKQAVARVSQPLQDILDPILAKTPLSDGDHNRIVLEKRDGLATFYDEQAQRRIATMPLSEEMLKFGDGMYSFGVKARGTKADVMHEAVYLYDSHGTHTTGILLAGSLTEDFIEKQRQVIYADPNNPLANPRVLPAKAKQAGEFTSFPVVPKMLREAQKYYSPTATEKNYITGVDQDGAMVILGRVITILPN